MRVKKSFLTVVVLILALSTIAVACKSATTTTTPNKPGSGAGVNSDSIVTAKIQSITKQSTGYPWKLEVLIQNTQYVDTLPNPVKNNIGGVVTVVTDQSMISFKVNDIVTAKIKYSGDVNIPGGIRLYMYDINLEIHP